MQRIFTAGQHLQAMISDLIDIAKIDVNAIELSSEAFDVGELLREVYEHAGQRVGAGGSVVGAFNPGGQRSPLSWIARE